MFRNLNLRIENLSALARFFIAAALLTGLTWLDVHNGTKISLLPLDWIPVAFAAWYMGGLVGALFGAVSVALASMLHVNDRPEFWDFNTLVWAGLIRGGSYLFLTWICDRFRGSYFRELETRRETQAAATRIKASAQMLIGHEIANAVTVLETAADLMAKDGGEGRAASLDTFKAVLTGMQAASRGFIEETRMQSARISEKFDKVDLAPLIADVVRPFAPLTAQRKLAVTLEVRAGKRVWGDRAALSLILSNLFSNAVKFTKPGGRVCVTVAFSPDGREPARVEVSDDGPGISPESMKTGSGFRMVRELLGLHNAFLDVETADGKGSRFSFLLNEVSERA